MTKIFYWLIGLTLFLFTAALFAFPMSVSLGKNSTDPDSFEVTGLLVAVGLFFLTVMSALLTAHMWGKGRR